MVKLPDDRPEIFDQYLQSAYTRTFKLEEKTKDELVKLTSQEYHHYISHAYDQLFGVYVLAEKFQNTSAKNKAITAIFERTHFKHEQDKLNSSRVPSPLVANMVYDATPVGSPARRLVAELFGTVHTTIPMRIFARSRLCADLVDDAFALAGDMQQLKNAVQGKLCLSKNVEDYLE